MLLIFLSYAIMAEVVQISAKDSFDYCLPSNSRCWPSKDQWNELKSKISSGKLHDISNDDEYSKVCGASASDPGAAYTLEDTGEGRCMQYHDCSKKKCDEAAAWNIPEYSVEASEENDIIEAIKFANKHNIQVVVKTTGHNYAGASMGDGALLIWMRHFKKYGDIKKVYEKCGETYDAVLKVGGGQVWEEAYKAVGNDYHLVGGGGLTVSAAGGWLNGGGLSASSRLYGMGIDQVIEFEVITADGSKVIASKCENDDLFWALRGGGGGSFGVTTSVHYKLHPTLPFCEMSFVVSDFKEPLYDTTTVFKWINLLVDSAPTLDTKWGGYWTLNSGIFYYQGTEDETKNSEFYKKINDLGNISWASFRCGESYFAARGGPDNLATDQTGQKQFNIASRLIPMDFVEKQPDKMKGILIWMIYNGFFTFNYIIGGKMMDVATDATAVHPAMRQSVFQIETFDERLIQKLRDELPNSGAGFNHAAKNEPDWENQFWGSNRARLESLKKKWDPDNRFNCWHCVGYLQGSSCTSSLSTILYFLVFVYCFFRWD